MCPQPQPVAPLTNTARGIRQLGAHPASPVSNPSAGCDFRSVNDRWYCKGVRPAKTSDRGKIYEMDDGQSTPRERLSLPALQKLYGASKVDLMDCFAATAGVESGANRTGARACEPRIRGEKSSARFQSAQLWRLLGTEEGHELCTKSAKGKAEAKRRSTLRFVVCGCQLVSRDQHDNHTF